MIGDTGHSPTAPPRVLYRHRWREWAFYLVQIDAFLSAGTDHQPSGSGSGPVFEWRGLDTGQMAGHQDQDTEIQGAASEHSGPWDGERVGDEVQRNV